MRLAEVAGLREGFVTLRLPDGGAGQFLEIDCPPHFAPEVGELVPLLMSGPKPKLFPQVIAVDAITAREIKAGSIEAGHITAGAIDGQVITGAIFQTAPPGVARVVIDAAGARLEAAEGTPLVNLDTATGSALFTGVLQTNVAGYRLRIAAGNDLGSTIDFLTPSLDPNHPVRIYTEEGAYGLQELTVQSATRAVGGGGLNLSVVALTSDAFILSRRDGYTSSGIEFNAAGFKVTANAAVNGKTPAAPPTLPAAATDLASALTLVNALRTLAIDTGWGVP